MVPSSAHTDATLRFLQRRVALFGLVTAGIGYGFLGFRAFTLIALGQWKFLTHPSFYLHLLASTVFAMVWLVCRSGVRSHSFIRVAEAAGLVLGCAAYQAMALFIPAMARPEMIMLLALSYGLFARAIYVPSTAQRTAILGAIVGVPMLVATYFMYSKPTAHDWPAVAEILTSELGTGNLVVGAVIGTLVWWALLVTVCTAASKVIYGLRREVASVRKLGQYTLERKLGEGGMGEVYEASHAMLRRPTAVKLLPPDAAGENRLARFEREVQLTAQLTHPNTITVFDYGRTPDGLFYYAMELLDGASLSEVVEVSGAQHPDRVIHALLGCAGALVEAHGVGLIHRDIKPANIMLCRQGGLFDVPKLLDFGLVKDVEQRDAGLSHADVITGTPQYLAPEAIVSPDVVDGRADIYALGAVGYFLLTGKHVFEGKTVVEVCSKHLHEAPIPPSERLQTEVPGPLEDLLLSCLAKEPDTRPASAQIILDQLEDLGSNWDQSQARAWWANFASAVSSHRSDENGAIPERTLGIELGGRG